MVIVYGNHDCYKWCTSAVVYVVAMAATSDEQVLWSLYVVAMTARSDVQLLWSLYVPAVAATSDV